MCGSVFSHSSDRMISCSNRGVELVVKASDYLHNGLPLLGNPSRSRQSLRRLLLTAPGVTIRTTT
jgi:hypothetical protein